LISSEILAALLGSAVVASLITALFAKAKSDKDAIVDNIIAERKAWRDRLRDLVSGTERCYRVRDPNGIASIEAQLVVLLNPYDKEDLKIIEALKNIPDGWAQAQLQEFMDRVAYLLKHDWERVKQEATTRTSPQSLGLAAFVVGLIVVVSEWRFGLGSSLQTVQNVAFWLSAVFFFISLFNIRLTRAFSIKKALCWITNKPCREPYRRRDER